MKSLYYIIKYAFITLWSVFVISPFLWALSTSFKNANAVTGGATYIPWLQFQPTMEGWRVLVKSGGQGGIDIIAPYINSIVVTMSASVISLILGTLAAYALSRFTFKAFFIMLSKFGLLDSLPGLVIVYVALLMPIAVWIMVDFFNGVPREIDETALIDGCNPFQAFYKVVLPNSLPGLIVAFLFCIIFGWNDFFFAFVLTFTKVQLIPVAIVALNSSVTPWWSLSASALVSVAPLVIIAFIVERYLSKGNLSGAIK
jgi:multiple sugar transport system permease protein